MSSGSDHTPLVPPFVGFSELQARHTDLLREFHASGGTKALNEEAIVFVQRGSRTGELLDAEEERQAAQQILDHWATLLYRMTGQAPDATLSEFDPAQLPTLNDEDCPYLGLDAFGEDEHGRFFGRERLLSECTSVLLRNRVLAVIGQSGSGKSSLVAGGLLAGLRSGEFPQFPESSSWIYVGPVFPGTDPVDNLFHALLPKLSKSQGTEQMAAELRRDPSLLPSLLESSRGTLLIVDQFEETFTLCEGDETRALFLKLLVAFTEPGPVLRRVIITMRSEFETWVARDPVFSPLFSAGQIRMAPMEQDELRRAIENPASAVGLKFETGVVDALLHDTLGEPAALPMLQFALLKLWETRQHNRITLESYQKLGGARLALANSANDFYLRLTAENQDTARRILLRMVRIGDGLEVHSQRVKLASLYETGEDPNRIEFVVGELARAHLVRITGQETPAAQIEVAHEALIRNWPTLLEWIQRKRTDLLTRRRLNEYSAEWIRRNRSDAGLLDAELLPEAERWIKSDAAREFGHHEALPKLIEASRAKQTAENQRRILEVEAKQRARLRLVIALLVLSGVILALGITSFVKVRGLQGELNEREGALTTLKEDFGKRQQEAETKLSKAQNELTSKVIEIAQSQSELKKEQATVEYLIEQLKALKPAEKVIVKPTNAVTVEYAGSSTDNAKIDKLLKRSGFLGVRKENSAQDPAINALFYGMQVKFDDVKGLARGLIDSGIALRAVDPIIGKNASQPLIQLVASETAKGNSALTASQVQSLKPRAASDIAELAPVSTIGAKILIFFARQSHRQQAEQAAAALAEVGYTVLKPQDMEPWNRHAPEDSQVRYFRFPTDNAEADFISKLLSSFDPNLRSAYVNDPESSKNNSPVFEIWFGRNSFPTNARSPVPTIPRIFIRAGTRSGALAEKLKAQLEESRFWVRIFQRASDERKDAEVDYYDTFPGDAEEAAHLIVLLKKLNISPIAENPVSIASPNGARSRHFEIVLP